MYSLQHRNQFCHHQRTITGWWYTYPLKNMTSWIGMMISNSNGKIKVLFQSTNQLQHRNQFYHHKKKKNIMSGIKPPFHPFHAWDGPRSPCLAAAPALRCTSPAPRSTWAPCHGRTPGHGEWNEGIGPGSFGSTSEMAMSWFLYFFLLYILVSVIS